MLGEIKLNTYELTNLLTTRINLLSNIESQVIQQEQQSEFGIDQRYTPSYYGIQTDQGVADIVDEVESLWHALKEKYEGVAESYDRLFASAKSQETGRGGCCPHHHPRQNVECGS